MRTWVVMLAVSFAGCKGKSKETPKEPTPVAAPEATAKTGLVAPRVAVATAVATKLDVPPFLLVADEAGGIALAAAATWADVDAHKLAITKPVPRDGLDALDRFTREHFYSGRMGPAAVEAIRAWDLAGALARDKPVEDDPPPPAEEDEDVTDDSGGSGTMTALEEGRMGQYKMKKIADDPQLARQQAIEAARTAGILGDPALAAGHSGIGVGPDSGRLAKIAGLISDDKIAPVRVMVLAPPTMKATALIEIVRETRASIAVTTGDKVRPLRLDFNVRDGSFDTAASWVEVRVASAGMVVEAVPDKPLALASLTDLAKTLDDARKTRGTDARAPVDVLVDADIDVQKLVDVLVALDTAGVRSIGIGPMPTAEQLAVRGHRIPRVSAGNPSAQGELDKAEIRRVVRANLAAITDCYTKQLAINPTLEGHVQVQFFIKPTGKVAKVAASGVDDTLASCVAGVVEGLAFPKPRGGVQVSYPFDFRP